MFKLLSSLFVVLFVLSNNVAKCHTYDSIKGRASTTYVLLISIGNYPKESTWPNSNSSEDISNISSFIKKFSSSNNIQKILQDKNATKKNIVESIKNVITKISVDDNVYFHFSGAGFQVPDPTNTEVDGKDEVFMPYDAPSILKVQDDIKKGKTPDLSHCLVDNELANYINIIRKKLGSSGQFLFTIDAPDFGPVEANSLTALGRGGFLEVIVETLNTAPIIMITSSHENESPFTVRSKSDSFTRYFSIALKTYADNLISREDISYRAFFSHLSMILVSMAAINHPTITGEIDENYLFNSSPSLSLDKKRNPIDKDARLFILSIGISTYKSTYTFDNCDEDARLFTQTIKEAFEKHSKAKIQTYELLNDTATKEAIYKAINEIIIQAKDNDIFAFFFAGFTNQPQSAGGEFAETWFYPHTKKRVSIDNRYGFIEEEMITLTDLKKLLDYLKCDKQLLFTEAGPSMNFKREFVKSMIKTSPVIADIVKRNRVIVVPVTTGLDNTTCEGRVDHGPGLYYFDKLKTVGVNLFDLFASNKATRQNVLFRYGQLQNECKSPDYDYMSFFFEKEFVEDLQYYFSKDETFSKTNRGGIVENEKPEPPPVIKKKYALLIGTDIFNNNGWGRLSNPINDARAIADTLSRLFGYKTKILKNPGFGEIYRALYEYNSILKEDDQFLLYIAGHGHFDKTIYQDGFIVANDSRALKADTFLTSYIPFNQLRIITDNFKARQVMVLLDVCFSGAFDDNEELVGNNNYNLSTKLDNRSVNKKLQMVTRKYITAGSRIEEVPDNFKGGHSPFAWFLLDGLRRAAKEKKYISSGMLFKFIQAYLEDTVPLQSGYGKDQLRLGSEFIFMSNQ